MDALDLGRLVFELSVQLNRSAGRTARRTVDWVITESGSNEAWDESGTVVAVADHAARVSASWLAEACETTAMFQPLGSSQLAVTSNIPSNSPRFIVRIESTPRTRADIACVSRAHRRIGRCLRRGGGFWSTLAGGALRINAGLPVSKPSYPASVSPMTIPSSVILNARRSLL